MPKTTGGVITKPKKPKNTKCKRWEYDIANHDFLVATGYDNVKCCMSCKHLEKVKLV